MTTIGSSDPATAATLKSALEASLPQLFSLKAHFEVEANVSAAATGNADAIVDIKPSCIQKVIAASAVSDIAAGVNASSSVVATVQ